MIGDPHDTSERALNPLETVNDWAGRIRSQLERFVHFNDSPTGAVVVNNLDWTGPMSVVEFLREVGKHFSINTMLARETVKRRLDSDGMSYTEFSYLLLQSQDYLQLFRSHGCRLQIGGSDQWGNIIGGVDLVRRVESSAVYALTTPLITWSTCSWSRAWRRARARPGAPSPRAAPTSTTRRSRTRTGCPRPRTSCTGSARTPPGQTSHRRGQPCGVTRDDRSPQP